MREHWSAFILEANVIIYADSDFQNKVLVGKHAKIDPLRAVKTASSKTDEIDPLWGSDLKVVRNGLMGFQILLHFSLTTKKQNLQDDAQYTIKNEQIKDNYSFVHRPRRSACDLGAGTYFA